MSRSLEERLLRSVNTLLRLFTIDERRFPSAEGRLRYNPLDFQTLRFLAQHPGAKAADVARAQGVAPTTQQAVMDRLVRVGLIDRTPHPESGRAKAHALTEQGGHVVAAILRQDVANMQSMLACLDSDEQQQAVALLEKVARRLDPDD